MTARPCAGSRRRRVVLGFLGVLLALGLGSCSVAGPATGNPSAPPPTRQASPDLNRRMMSAQLTLQKLTRAAKSDTGADIARLVSTADPAFDAAVDMLRGNLQQLGDVGWEVTDRTAELPAARSALLGPQAWTARVKVAWQMSGDPESSLHLAWLTFVPVDPANPSGDQLLAGLSDGPAGDSPRPLWLLEAVKVQRKGPVTVMSGHKIDPQPWLEDGAEAAFNVDEAGLGPLVKGWKRRLSLVVPSTERTMEQVLNVRRGTYSGIAATTIADSEDRRSTTVPIRVVVNPKTYMPKDTALLILTHEATHVATNSAHSVAPLWAVEGLADYVAFNAYPWAARAQQDAQRHLLAEIPQGLPTEKDFDAAGDDLNLSYLRAWLAVREMRNLRGADAMMAMMKRLADGASLAEVGVNEKWLGREVARDLELIRDGQSLR